ncbi:DUF4856 domain-containing protein [Psychroserpens sp. S379A]|uniref:DUF4856 domain-containing protein n=1 Tax=Psychroserpens sp. S379A TaxID=3415137 RepID=UPI003C7C5672
MKKITLILLALVGLFTSCSNDDDSTTNSDPQVVAPATYSFERNGQSTISYGGQTTRIMMGQEFINALKDETLSEAQIDAMFAHVEGNASFSNPDLNASNKSIRSKTAASSDYFSANTTDANAIKADFDSWIAAQVNDVYPNWNTNAVSGVAGQIQEAGGGSIRYVNEKGLEYNQAVNKALIGALMVDQMLNNYLSTSVLDAGENRANNDAEILAEGKNYTTMEHKWDEAFGYLYGTDNAEVPMLEADSFLNKYLSKVDSDEDFTGIASNIYNAFKLGRAAIVAKEYTVRDQQANIIRKEVSKIIAIRAIYYLQQGKIAMNGGNQAGAFHDLSEGFGFIYSLQFTRQPNSDDPYFTKIEVDTMISELMEGNGFWDVSNETLDAISQDIADVFGISMVEAAS